MKEKPCFLGVDLGTTGMRAVVSDERGNILTAHSEDILKSMVPVDDERYSEQNPEVWEQALWRVLEKILAGISGCRLLAVCVDSTSGTILPLDRNLKPLYNAFLHNDVRAQEESRFIIANTGINAKPSFAISKILWLKRHLPEIFGRTWKFIHAADYVRGLISGDFGITDFSNAVKTGYDLERYCWPDSIEKVLGIPVEKLPYVVKTGEAIGTISQHLEEKYGIERSVKVVAGATDSTTSFYSSGAERVGDWNTTIGTVLGIRGISERFIPDPEGLLYTHRHPEGFWLPGAASNTGGEALRMFFGYNLEEYDRLIEGMPPTGGLIYPLVRKSEKFPFMNMEAVGFINATLSNPQTLFKGFLEGISFIERMIYEKIASIGYEVGDRIFSMGGGAYSSPWLQIRADVLNKTICRAREVEAAFGAAIIAAGGSYYSSLSEAIENMVHVETIVEPGTDNVNRYDEIYAKFIDECRKRGLF
ncbi:MAG: FGGY-family carbohydrate kinase [Spirochaetota bacterium]